MSDGMQDMGDALRRQGWRQGSILTADALRSLAGAIPPSITVAVVISQDCDVVRDHSAEPTVELLCGRSPAEPDNQYLHSKNPRIIHLTCSDGSTHVELDIRSRVAVEKHRLASHGPDLDRQLSRADVRDLAAWVARRYTRPAFPDAFNERLRAVDDKLTNLIKKECSRPVTAVYVMLEDFEAELPQEKPYEIVIWFSCRLESLTDPMTQHQVYEFSRRYREILSACPGIVVVDDEVRSEDKISLSEIKVFRRFDYESRSLAPRPGGDGPPGVP